MSPPNLLIDPFNGDIADIAQLVERAKRVITVDTALAHLCAWMEKKCNVLLPIYPDERWYKLRKVGNIYSNNCSFAQQSKYGDWGKEVENLAYCIRNVL